MTDWTEAAVDTAMRTNAARQAVNSRGGDTDTTVRVSAATKAELERRQQAFAAAHPGGKITVDGIIAGLLAGQPVQP